MKFSQTKKTAYPAVTRRGGYPGRPLPSARDGWYRALMDCQFASPVNREDLLRDAAIDLEVTFSLLRSRGCPNLPRPDGSITAQVANRRLAENSPASPSPRECDGASLSPSALVIAARFPWITAFFFGPSETIVPRIYLPLRTPEYV